MPVKVLGPDPKTAITQSNAERKLISMLKTCQGINDWTVIWGLPMEEHETKTRSEGDLVILVPGKGTFVLEVKGGGIEVEGNQWFSNGKAIQNPVLQAESYLSSVKNWVSKREKELHLKKGTLSNTLFVYGVVFPDCRPRKKLDEKYPGISGEMVADLDDCDSGTAFKEYIERLTKYWNRKLEERGSHFRAPHWQDSGRIEEILKVLCPTITVPEALKRRMETVTDRVKKLEASQAVVLEGLQENPRCMITGGGGTGKTVLAISQARLYIGKGLRTGFFCYNKKLASHLRRSMEGFENVICDSFTDYMEACCIQAGLKLPAERDAKYYRELLPEMFGKALKILKLPKLEALVLDEAQDLMSEPLLAALNHYLEGGLKNGRWFFFMDPHQDIFGVAGDEQSLQNKLKLQEADRPAQFLLTRNYRNAKYIAKAIDKFFHTETISWKNVGLGEQVKIFKLESDNQEYQAGLLEKCLKELQKDVSFDDIVILSSVGLGKSAAGKLDTALWPLTEDYENRKGKILFSTIQAYKGLDSQVVILTNIHSKVDPKVLYTGMSRAIGALYIHMSENAYEKWVKEKKNG